MNCYLHEGIVFIPSIAKISSGGQYQTDPVAVVPLSDVPRLIEAMRKDLTRLVPTVPRKPHTPDRPHPVLKHTGMKTWAAFERKAQLWTLKERDGGYILHRWRKARGGGYETDLERYEHLPMGTTQEAACRLLIERMVADTAVL